MAVCSAARGHPRAKETPSLMAGMYGFTLEEEMSDTKAYLCSHGGLSVGTGRCQATGHFVAF